MSEPLQTERPSSSEQRLFIQGLREQLQEKPHGHFYRYLYVTDVHTLLSTGTLQFDGKRAYAELMRGPFRRSGMSEKNAVATTFMSAFARNDENVPEYVYEEKTGDEIDATLKLVEKALVQKDQKYAGLATAFHKTLTDKDTMPLVEYLKTVGGDTLLAQIQRMGMGEGYFSDLMSLSVGAPLNSNMYANKDDSVVVVELDFSLDELITLPEDTLFEHEVLVRTITTENLRRVYSYHDVEELFAFLAQQYPEYFEKYYPDPFTNFAKKKPLNELLAEFDKHDASEGA